MVFLSCVSNEPICIWTPYIWANQAHGVFSSTDMNALLSLIAH